MTVREMLEALAQYPADAIVLIPGYEQHWDEADVAALKRARREDPGADWFNGDHVLCGGTEGAPAVVLASRRRPDFARAAGLLEAGEEP